MKKTRFEIICRYCKKPFVVTPTEFKFGRRLCSMECRLAEKDELKNRVCVICGKSFCTKRASSKTRVCSDKCTHELRKRGEFRNCEECGKQMWVMPVHFETSRFCSRECLGKWHSKTFIGDKHPNWRGGTSVFPYPFEWNDDLKNKIKERDTFTCQHCGSGENLTVHHIDYNKENLNLNNLITLCNVCNIKANYGRERWMEFYQSRMEIIYG